MDYRIEDLARIAKTTVRNIRAYQDRGILPPPRKDGRVAIYSDAHLARLRIVSALLERGYTIANIAELVESWERGGELREVLGIEHAITTPFTDEVPTALSREEIETMSDLLDAENIARAVASGLVEIHDGEVVAPSLRLLRAGVELHRAGVPMRALFDEIETLARDVDRIATRFVGIVGDHIVKPSAVASGNAKRLADAIQRIRPLAAVIVTTQLARSLERAVRARVGVQFPTLGRAKAKRARRKRAR